MDDKNKKEPFIVRLIKFFNTNPITNESIHRLIHGEEKTEELDSTTNE